MSLYVMSSYGAAEEKRRLREKFAKAGKKLDMAKACIRFRNLEDLPLEVIGEMVRRAPAKTCIERHTALLARRGRRAAKSAGKKASTKSHGRSRTSSKKSTRRDDPSKAAQPAASTPADIAAGGKRSASGEDRASADARTRARGHWISRPG